MSITSTILFVMGLRWGVLGFVWGQTLGAFAGTAVSFQFGKSRYRLVFSFKMLKKLLVFSLPLIPSSLSVLVWNYTDRFFIRNYLDLESVGVYGIGMRFASIASILIAALNMALTPTIYFNYKKDRTPGDISKVFSFFMLSLSVLLAGVVLFSKEVLIIMTTEKYYGASAIIPFLMTGVVLSHLYNFAPGLFIAKKTFLIVVVNVITCLFSISMNFLLIPRLGIMGASISNAANGLLVFCLYIYFGQREYRITYQLKDLVVAASTVLLAYGAMMLFFSEVKALSALSITAKAAVFLMVSVLPIARLLRTLRKFRGSKAENA